MNKNNMLSDDTFEVVDGNFDHELMLIADHASNYIPPEFNGLGLDDEQLARHIAYDIGVREFTLKLAKRLDVPAVLSGFSRLLIDPNRGVVDPTLVMRVADGNIIDGNRNITATQKQERIERFYTPYDDAISQMIDRFDAKKTDLHLVSIHSFTPIWRGNRRKTEVGMLWFEDKRFTSRIMDLLAAEYDFVVHENLPYSGGYAGDTMCRHGLDKRLEHCLLELRQDFLSTEVGIDEWVNVFASILPQTVKNYKKLK